MANNSAGLLMYRRRPSGIEVLLAHPGGPFWAKKDEGAWSIPKGEFTPDEDALNAARREFFEETGLRPAGTFLRLTPSRQPSGKVVHVWAFEGEWEPSELKSNTFALEWPKGSGKMKEFPEVDRAAWYELEEARRRILSGQVGFLDELAAKLK